MKIEVPASAADIEPFERAFGIESELGITIFGTYPDNLKHPQISDLMPGLEQAGQFLSNGARLYSDMGHVEYATPECLSVRELVAAYFAGQTLMQSLAEDFGWVLNNRVVDDKLNTWGVHENYLVAREGRVNPHDSRVASILASHLATRPLLSGGGYLTPQDGRYVFKLFQKMPDIVEVANGTTTRSKEKPFINLRDEPHSRKELFRRLHVIGVDPTMSPWSSAYAAASTSTVIRLIEHGADFSGYMIADPVAAGETVSSDLTFDRKIRRERGKPLLPMEYQQALAEAALDLAVKIELPPDERAMLDEWYQATEDFLRDPYSLKDRVDWVWKKAKIDDLDVKTGDEVGEKKVLQIDRYWGELSKRGIAIRLRQGGIKKDKNPALKDPLDTLPLSEKFVLEAPTGRASLRGGAIIAIANNGHSEAGVNWEHIGIGAKTVRIDRPNPTRRSIRSVEKLLATLTH